MTMDPLADLVVDEQQLAREEIAGALSPYVRFGRGGDILLQPAFDDLPATSRVVCTLLALRAACLLELRKSDGVTPQQLTDSAGIPGGTARPVLRRLLRDHTVVQEGKFYRLAPHSMQRVARLLV